MSLSLSQSFPNDEQKMRTVLSGSLYAYEIPPHYRQSASPTHLTREGGDQPLEPQDEEELEEVTESKTDKAEGVEPSTKEAESTTEGAEISSERAGPETEDALGEEQESGRIKEGNGDVIMRDEEGENGKEEEEEEEEGVVEVKKSDSKQSQSSAPPPQARPSYCNPMDHGFIFAVHRRTVRGKGENMILLSLSPLVKIR